MTRAVRHLDCGTLCPPARLLGGERLVCHVVVVETDRDGLVLVDTGFGAADCASPGRVPRLFRTLVRPRLDPAQTALAQLRALGYLPDDVRHIVVTHLDLDHAGGLPDFPAAAVHLHRPEYVAAIGRPRLADRIRYPGYSWRHEPRWVTYAAEGDTWMGLPAVRALDGVRDDIALVPLGGHTAGHSGVAVRTGDGWLLHAGDAYFHRDELVDGGRVPLGLRGLAARDDVVVVCSHDPVELDVARHAARDQSSHATVVSASSPAAT
jgi:glyoxylase-like metal-dependent hydrolase (beta-lactamase superfamily II)